VSSFAAVRREVPIHPELRPGPAGLDRRTPQPAIAGALLAEVTKFGAVHVKRAYGDWTAAIRPHQRKERHRRIDLGIETLPAAA
jgi:hypothetical protein